MANNADVISLLDEDGMQHDFEELTRVTLEEGTFTALMSLEEDSDEIVLLRIVDEDGETWMEPITDEAVFAAVSAKIAEELDELFAFEE